MNLNFALRLSQAFDHAVWSRVGLRIDSFKARMSDGTMSMNVSKLHRRWHDIRRVASLKVVVMFCGKVITCHQLSCPCGWLILTPVSQYVDGLSQLWLSGDESHKVGTLRALKSGSWFEPHWQSEQIFALCWSQEFWAGSTAMGWFPKFNSCTADQAKSRAKITRKSW